MSEPMTVTVGLDVHARLVRQAAVRADELWKSGHCPTRTMQAKRAQDS